MVLEVVLQTSIYKKSMGITFHNNILKGMNINEEVFDMIANRLKELKYDFTHDESLPVGELTNGPSGPSSSNTPLSLEDDPTFPKQASDVLGERS